MWGKTASEICPARAALAAVAAGFLLWAACAEEEPVSRRASWREVAPLPEGVRTFYGMAVAPDGAFYAAAAYSKDSFSDPFGVVYRSDGGALEEVFRSPEAGTGLGAIGAAGDVIWAAGSKKIDMDYRPYVVRFAEGRWREVNVPAEVEGRYFSAAYPLGSDFCWFKSEEGIYTYDNGSWRTALVLEERHGKDDFCVAARGRAFFAGPATKTNPPGGAAVKIFVSDDRGASWREETMRYPDLGRPFYGPVRMVRAAGDEIFALTLVQLPRYLMREGHYYTTAIFRRDGAPAGRGHYSLVFEAERGDYFSYIDAMAFRSAAEGYAVGPFTSVALERGEWHVEAWQKSFSPWLEEVVAGPSGYWAVGMPRYEGPRRLYHIP
jgi:hypothetical protein